MNFKTQVTLLEPESPFPFSPTMAELFVTPAYDRAKEGEPEVMERVIDVQVNLTQVITGGKIVQERVHTFPATVLAAIGGVDAVTLQPMVNWQAVAPLFAEFGLVTVPE